MKIWINIIIVGSGLFFAGIFYITSTGHGFGIGSVDGLTISTIGVILMIIGALLWKMKKVNTIKQAYEELDNAEKDSKD